MKLKDFIKKVLEEQPEIGWIKFEVNLYSDTTVADEETGNKVTFEVLKRTK